MLQSINTICAQLDKHNEYKKAWSRLNNYPVPAVYDQNRLNVIYLIIFRDNCCPW